MVDETGVADGSAETSSVRPADMPAVGSNGVNNNNNNKNEDGAEQFWSISVRTVGGAASSPSPPFRAPPVATASAASPSGGADGKMAATAATATAPPPAAIRGTDGHHAPFAVQVDPSVDTLDSLHERIRERTGLPVDRQRLIYRGKIISSGGGGGACSGGTAPSGVIRGSGNGNGHERQKESAAASPARRDGGRLLRDVAGLGDGQTIHLVPRPAPTAAAAASSASTLAMAAGRASSSSAAAAPLGGGADDDEDDAASDALLSALLGGAGGGGTSVSAALLAALLGGGSGGGNRGAAAAASAAADAGTAGAATSVAAATAAPSTSDLLGSEIGQLLTGGTTPPVAAPTATAATAPAPANRTVGARRQRRGTTRPSHILTAQELEERRVQRLDSLEPVRQGLMTSHTMLHGAGLGGKDAAAAELTSSERQGLPPRRFYRGQWVDALDTVNSWLEATIVDVATPEDVVGIRPPASSGLSQHYHGEANPHRNRRSSVGGVVRRDEDELLHGEDGAQQHRAGGGRQGRPRADPIVGATDWEGRRMLLLEPDPDAEECDSAGPAYSPAGGQDLSSYRERPSNTENAVQLLLIHYNGWPKRWDEWLRSDSPRIRPFRSRTRHGVGAQGQSSRQRQSQSHPDQGRVGACPSIRAAFHASPPTHIRPRGPGTPLLGDEETSERIAALMELRSVLRTADGLIAACVEEHERNSTFGETNDGETNQVEREDSIESYRPEFDRRAYDEEIVDGDGNDDEDSISRFFGDDDSFLVEGEEEDRARYLPWNCRASGIETGCDTTTVAAARRLDPATRLNALGPLLDRVGRVCVSLAPHVSAMGEDYPIGNPDNSEDNAGAPIAEAEAENQAFSDINGHQQHGEVDENEVGSEAIGVQKEGSSLDEGEEEEDHEEDDLFFTNVQRGPASEVPQGDAEGWSAEPDMTDFSNAIVNDSPLVGRSPTRGSRSENRGGGTSLADNLTSALLAAALVSSTGARGGGRGVFGDGGGGSTTGAAETQVADGSGVGGPRFINLGGGNLMAGGPGLGGGIDIHVTMLVSPGERRTVGAGAGGAGTNNTFMTPTAHAPSPLMVDDEQDNELFDELYTETPSPTSWGRSAGDDDSSSPPSTFDPYDDDLHDSSIDAISMEESDDISVQSEPRVLSEIESIDDNDSGAEEEDEGVELPMAVATAAFGSASTSEMDTPVPIVAPFQAATEDSGEGTGTDPTASPSSRSTPRRSPLSRLFRRSHRRRNN